MALVAPSMLSADFLHLSQDVAMVNAHADIFHLDVMDGTFVPNISFGFPVIDAIASEAAKPLDVHLMIVEPWKYIERVRKTGAAMVSFHLEATRDAGRTSETLALARSCGMKAGLVINPDVPVEDLFPFLEEVDFILIMSVFAGFGGQKFIPSSLERIATLRAEIVRRGLPVQIEVDGGVSPSNAAALRDAGADILVAGSSVFKAADPAAAIAAIRG